MIWMYLSLTTWNAEFLGQGNRANQLPALSKSQNEHGFFPGDSSNRSLQILYWYQFWLVVWNMNFMTFHSVGNFIIPTDELIFFRGVGIPPDLNRQLSLCFCFRRYSSHDLYLAGESYAGVYAPWQQGIQFWGYLWALTRCSSIERFEVPIFPPFPQKQSVVCWPKLWVGS